ncbi:MAG: tRNA epoxyqueuosine(34) reductase QueG, partial [Gemmatimonadota bacterium]|nr:tRNA epoxyqueuosine(34) reductase QueG [Gemmatimonadota bacterium]
PHAAPALSVERAARVKAEARRLGFSDAGITDLTPTPHGDALDTWLARGLAGTMRYMHRQAERRKRPAEIVAGAIRVVVVMYNYAHEDAVEPPDHGHVAKYARGPDYHQALRPALDGLAMFIREIGGPSSIARAYVDAGPVPERELAQRAGLGWIGKNTMLITPMRGSYTLLASVLTSVDLAADPPFRADRCGSCTKCLDACPTAAFPKPRVLDATRCVSYLTIEYRGPVAPELGSATGSWVFGCDVCQDVCPWNQKFARTDGGGLLPLDPARAWVPLDTFTALDERTFDDQYGWTPLARPGLSGMRRNAALAAANASRLESS